MAELWIKFPEYELWRYTGQGMAKTKVSGRLLLFYRSIGTIKLVAFASY
jgi:hypothetical protein